MLPTTHFHAPCADPTWRQPVAAHLAKRWSPGAPFRFALPGPEFLDGSFEGPGGEPVRRGALVLLWAGWRQVDHCTLSSAAQPPLPLPFAGPRSSLPAEMATAWTQAVQRLEALGGTRVEAFDFAPFAETAVLLYGAAFVAERYAGALTGACMQDGLSAADVLSALTWHALPAHAPLHVPC